MAQEDVRLSGTFLDSAGNALAGKVVKLFAEGTITSEVAEDETDSAGEWDFTRTTPGRYDVQLVNGTQTYRVLSRDKFQVTELQSRNATSLTQPAGIFTNTYTNGGAAAAGLTAIHSFRPATESTGVESAVAGVNGSSVYNDFQLTNSATTPEDFIAGRLAWEAVDVANGSEDSKLNLWTMKAGTLTEVLHLDGTSLHPETTDVVSLGTSALNFSDLFLDSGAVINLDGGDVTLTHSSNTLTVAGGTFATAALTATTVVASGIIKTDDTTAATTIADGSLQTDGGLSVTFDAVIGDDLILISDGAVLSLGIGADVTLTHDGTTGGTLAGNPIEIDSGGNITLDAHTGIFIFQDANTEILRITESGSGDVTIKLETNAKDLIFTDNGDATGLTIKDAAAGIVVPGEVMTTKISYTDGDDAITIADGGGITAAAGITSTAAANTFGTTSYGSAGSGVDVTFYSATSGDQMLWDTSAKKLVITGTDGANALEVTDGNVAITDNLTVSGNLTISGTTTTVDTTNTLVTDNLLELNSGATSNANDSGIIIERGSTGNNAILMWDESATGFTVGTTTATADSTGNLANFAAAPFTAAAITGTVLTGTTSGVFASDMTITSGSIVSASGAITFVDENLVTTGTLAAGATTITGNVLATGTITSRTTSIIAADTRANEIVAEGTAQAGMSILSTTYGNIYWGDAASDSQGIFRYDHSNDQFELLTAGSVTFIADESGLALSATDKLYLDGSLSGNTYIQETASDNLVFHSGGLALTLDSSQDATFAGKAIFGGSWIAGSDSNGYLRIYGDPSSSVAMNFDDDGTLFIGDTANANMTVGLTINQAANDNEILALKSSDVDHGMTDKTETDTFAELKKVHATGGGLSIETFQSVAADTIPSMQFIAAYAQTNADKTASSWGVFQLDGRLKSGTGTTTMASNDNLFLLKNNTSTVFIVDAEGELFAQGGTATTNMVTLYDGEDDIALSRSFYHALSDNGAKGIVRDRWDDWVQTDEQSLVDIGILGAPLKDGGLINYTGLARLNTGAIWQLNTKHMSLAEKVDGLEVELIAAKKQLAAISA